MMKISSSQAAPIPRAAMPRTMAEFVTVRSNIICNGDNANDDDNDDDDDNQLVFCTSTITSTSTSCKLVTVRNNDDAIMMKKEKITISP